MSKTFGCVENAPRGRNISKYMSCVGRGVVRTPGMLPRPPGYISLSPQPYPLRASTSMPANLSSRPSRIARPRSLRTPGRGTRLGRLGAPRRAPRQPVGSVWVCRKIGVCRRLGCAENGSPRRAPRPYRGLVSPAGAPCAGPVAACGLGSRAPRWLAPGATARAVDWRTLPAAHAPPPRPPPPPPPPPAPPAPPCPPCPPCPPAPARAARPWAGWLAGTHRPTAAAAGGPPARGQGTTPARGRRRASRLARGVTSGPPTAHAPAAPGPPPRSTPQPGAAGLVAVTSYMDKMWMSSRVDVDWEGTREQEECWDLTFVLFESMRHVKRLISPDFSSSSFSSLALEFRSLVSPAFFCRL
jgi:hypothetical protein